MKRKFVVDVPAEEMVELERLWYEYNASRDIIAFLMQQKGVIWETLQEYINVSEKRFTECEMKKVSLATNYKPAEVDLTKFNYSFDFQDDKITFEEA